MKKIIFVIFCLFILTGCEITYDLNLDNSREVVTAIGENEKLYDAYLKKPIPLSNLNSIISENNDKIKGVDYYEVSDISNEDLLGLKFIGNFKKVSDINDSSLVSFGSRDLSIEYDKEKFTIGEFNRIKLFEQFSDLDKITINIKTNRKVIKNNADKVNGNVYTWIINRSNYGSKTIFMDLKPDKNLIDIDNPIVKFAIVLISLAIVGFLIYLIINYRKKKVNNV